MEAVVQRGERRGGGVGWSSEGGNGRGDSSLQQGVGRKHRQG